MFETLRVNSWVSVTDGCPMTGCVRGGDAQFRFGDGDKAFEFNFDAEALRSFASMVTQALTNMDEPHAQE